MPPRISVITPVYNGIRFIESCINNVIEQECSAVEHIIVDGGSTDGTVDVIRRYAEKFPHIRWVSEKDRGQSDALNKCIAMATGNILSSLNVDDYYEAGALNFVLEKFATLPEPSLLVGNCTVWDDEGKILWVNKPRCLELKKLLIANEKHYPWPVNPSAYFYHKSLHDIIGLYNLELHYVLDIDFIIRAIMHSHAEYVDVCLGNFRLIRGTKTFENFGSAEARFLALINGYRQQLGSLDWLSVLLEALMLKCTDIFAGKRKRIVSIVTVLKSLIKKLPAIERIISERDKLRLGCGQFPPGHFYSPIPSFEEIRRDEARIFGRASREIPGIELNESEQIKLLEDFCQYYESMPFQPLKTEGLRYYFENPMYSYSDAIFLHCMIRHLTPARLIEIGSGFSSCMTLDTSELFLQGSLKMTLIEPYTDRLMSLIKEEDKSKIKIIPQRLQDVSLNEFKSLKANDILFVDSTHVSKIHSDVNRIFFEILPQLSSGVYVHFHDIFFPFEYPKEWIYEGRAWNEAYMLRSFLQYNSEFRVVLMNTFMENFHEPFFRENMPLCLKNTGGSIWIRKS